MSVIRSAYAWLVRQKDIKKDQFSDDNFSKNNDCQKIIVSIFTNMTDRDHVDFKSERYRNTYSVRMRQKIKTTANQ